MIDLAAVEEAFDSKEGVLIDMDKFCIDRPGMSGGQVDLWSGPTTTTD